MQLNLERNLYSGFIYLCKSLLLIYAEAKYLCHRYGLWKSRLLVFAFFLQTRMISTEN